MAEKKKDNKKKQKKDPTKITDKERRNPQNLKSTISVIQKRKLALRNI